jgi:gamma-glutamyltranspeptidase/glutathione hydrolase
MDKFGNVVAVTSSGGFFMTSPVVPALGFPLACRLEMSWLQDGLPNTLRPGNRPRTTLSPTMVLRDGEPSLVFGSPGADLQEQWSLAFLIRTVQGIPVQQAVELPNFHTEHLIGSFAPHKFEPGSVTVELEISKATIDELTGRGHDVIANRSLWYGRVSAIGRDSNTGLLFAAADPRHAQAYACGR